MSVRIQSGDTEGLYYKVLDQDGQPFTGLTGLKVRVSRASDDYILDWNDDTFKASGWTTIDNTLAEVDSTNLPGLYKVTGGLDTSAITNMASEDTILVSVFEDPNTNSLICGILEFKVGNWADQIDDILTDTSDMQPRVAAIEIDTNEIQGKLPDNYIMGSAVTTDKDDDIDAILVDTADMQPRVVAIETDTNEIQSKLPTNNIMGSSTKDNKDDEIDAILTDTAAIQPLVDVAVSTRSSHTANNVRDAILADSTPFNGADVATILTDTNEVQTKLPTNNIMGSSVKTDKDDEIDAIKLATDNLPADPASETNVNANETKIDAIQVDVTAILADTNAIDTRLPSDPADESLQQAAHTQTQSDIASLNNLAIADVQTALTNQGYTVARAPSLDNLDVAISTRSDFDEATNPVELLDTGGTAGTSAAELVVDIEADLASKHGSGQWDATGGWTSGEQEQIRDALGVTGTKTSATGGQLQDVLTDTAAIDARLPSDPADESLQQASHTQTQADIAALNNLAIADVQTAMTNQGYTAARAPKLDNADVVTSSRSAPGDAMDLITDSVDSNALATSAVDELVDGVWNEQLSGHTTIGSSGEAQNRLDADITSRAAPGDDMGLTANAVDSSSLDTTAVDEIVDGVWNAPTASYGVAGSAGLAQGRVDVAVSTRAQAGDAMTLTVGERDTLIDGVWTETLADHSGSVGSTAEALDDASSAASITPSALASAVWDKAASSHTGVGSMGELQNRLDADITSRAAPGDAMDLITDALDANSLATTAATEIADYVWDENITLHVGANSAGLELSGKAEPGDQMDLVNDAVDTNSLATSAVDDIADQVWRETLADHSGVVGSTAEALDSVAAPAAPATIAAAVWDRDITLHTAVDSAGEAQNRLDDNITSRSSHTAADVETLNAAAHGSGSHETATGFATPANITAAHGTTDSLVTSLHGSTDTAIAGVPAATEALNVAAHGAGSHQTATGFSTHTVAQVADAVWDESNSSHLSPGSTGESLDTAASSGAPPSVGAIADAVWNEDLSTFTTIDTAGEKVTAIKDRIG